MLWLRLLAGCASGVAADGLPPAAALEAMDRLGCAQCHAVPGLPPAAPRTTCAGCHQQTAAILRDPARAALAEEETPGWTAAARRVRSFQAVPSLEAAFVRLDADWVDAWLQDPHDLRPRLLESMPRLQLTPEDRASIVAAFADAPAVEKTPRPSKKNIAAGRARFLTLGCPSCHDVGRDVPASPGIATAPDLVHVRDRMDPDRVVAWIQDPTSISAAASMPSFDVSREDAILVRDWLFLGDLAGEPPPDDLPAVEAVQRPVSWAEVAPLFANACADCHLDPARPENRGRVVPGRDGGFGWPGIAMHVQSPEGLRPVADRIVPALLRRRQEARRDRVSPGQVPAERVRDDRPGMPMAAPPLTDPQIARISAWIAQGMPE
jgi:mono/diheme cytochrome c family protein